MATYLLAMQEMRVRFSRSEWARSSTAEHSAYIRAVVGASPTGPTARVSKWPKETASKAVARRGFVGSSPASRTEPVAEKVMPSPAKRVCEGASPSRPTLSISI